MSTTTGKCGYPGCPNEATPKLITKLTGVGIVKLSLNVCESHYDLRDVDDDVIDWMKEELHKQFRET